MHQTSYSPRPGWKRRAASLLLALALLSGLVPGLPGGAAVRASAHWADPYLSQLAEWGFIRDGQAEDPDKALTRADFVAIVNRAYGYREPGPIPFEDVSEKDWYYDDVAIAYTARYINGTSPTTASPNGTLTRETAATILGRNMMLQESPGEILDFTDARDISRWAQGTIKSSMEHYLVSGYNDGTFRPQKDVTWGEMAAMLTRIVGTPLQEPGDYSLGGVFGNVTITSPGVTLRDSVISGDLYVTGGVGLGGVALENVTVLGRIIASGAGQAEVGASSILLRNVAADELLVDNLQDNYVSVRADGITEIGRTTVRTSAYIEDNTPDGLGLKYISLEGDVYPEGEEPEDWQPIRLDLAGRVGEVANRTPGSTVRAARGSVERLTVHEEAAGSQVVIDRGAVVKVLDLDAAAAVTGEGDVGRLNVNAPGCTVAMLPDEIYIRPGLTAIIAGEEMDAAAAEEASLEPLILAGYPKAKDVAPTSLDAVFSTNKKGTVHWAVSAITDGSVGADELVEPPSYGSIAVRRGATASPRGNEETTARIAGLQPDGSYYLSAVLEDAKGQLSPVKVISFTTPDNTVPAFAKGYPRMSRISRTDSVAVVMPTKDCKLYYALLPQGAAAPTENELKTGAVSGALGYGVRDVVKNVEDAFRVNDQILEEKTPYVLYVWLVDANGANKSKITPLPFTTGDETPPEFIIDPSISTATVGKTDVSLPFRLNENGTVFWVAVKPVGAPYPDPDPKTEYLTAPLTSDWAKLQVSSGMGKAVAASGSVKAAGDVTGTIRAAGLERETYYDFYYMARDEAGNDSLTVKKITIHTEDATAPAARQTFHPSSETGGCKVNSAIHVEFSEDVIYMGEEGGTTLSLTQLQSDIDNNSGEAQVRAINKLANVLYHGVRLYWCDANNRDEGDPIEDDNPESKYKWVVDEKNEFTDDMLVDYTQARVQDHRKDGKGVWVVIPAEAVNLITGESYCFKVSDFIDTSSKGNPILYNPTFFWEMDRDKKKDAAGNGWDLDVFPVDFAAAKLREIAITDKTDYPVERDGNGNPKSVTEGTETKWTYIGDVDRSFSMTPDTTSLVAADYVYDLQLWTNRNVMYDLYYRVRDTKITEGSNIITDFTKADPSDAGGAKRKYSAYRLDPNDTSNAGKPDANGWMFLGNSGAHYNSYDEENPQWAGKSVGFTFSELEKYDFPKLVNMREGLVYEFAIVLTKWGSSTDPKEWVGDTLIQVRAAAASDSKAPGSLYDLGKGIVNLADCRSDWENRDKSIMSIGAAGNETYLQLKAITKNDTKIPEFEKENPKLTPSANKVNMNITLTREGTIYWAISEIANGTPQLTTQVPDGNGGYRVITQDEIPKTWPAISSAGDQLAQPEVKIEGDQQTVIYPDENDFVDHGSFSYTKRSVGGDVPGGSTELKPNTPYCAYFVLKGEKTEPSQIYVYQFTTTRSAKPQINITNNRNSSVTLRTEWQISSNYWYLVCTEENMLKIPPLSDLFTSWVDTRGEYVPEGKELPSYYSGLTVLDAMMQGYGDTCENARSQSSNADRAYFPTPSGYTGTDWISGASVFDVYAGAGVRDAVFEIARSANTGKITGVDSLDVVFDAKTGTTSGTGSDTQRNKKQDIRDKNNSEMGSGKYTILVVAQNQKWSDKDEQTNGGKSGFRAAVVDNAEAGVPKLINASMGQPEKASGGGYTGTIMLVFNSDLYKKGSKDPVDSTYFKANLASGSGTATIEPSQAGLTNTYYLNFSNHKIGAVISSTTSSGSYILYNDYGGANLDLYVESRKGTDKETVEDENGKKTTVSKEYIEYTVYWGLKDKDSKHKDYYKSEPFKFYIDDLGDAGTRKDVTKLEVTSDKAGTINLTTATIKSGSTSQFAYAILTPAEGTESAVVDWKPEKDIVTINGTNTAMHDVIIQGTKVGKTTVAVSVRNALLAAKTFTVTVQGKLGDPTLTADGLTKGTNGEYTWKRADRNRHTATLTIDTGYPADPEDITVSGIDYGAVRTSGRTATVELYFSTTETDRTAEVTVKGTDTNCWETGSGSKTIKITFVNPTAALTIESLTANSTNGNSVITASNGNYTWERKTNDTYEAKLTINTTVAMPGNAVVVTSSDNNKIRVETKRDFSADGTKVIVYLTYISKADTPVTITVKMNGETKTFTITTTGTNDAVITPAPTPGT